MSEKGYLFMLLVSFSVTDIPIPPPWILPEVE